MHTKTIGVKRVLASKSSSLTSRQPLLKRRSLPLQPMLSNQKQMHAINSQSSLNSCRKLPPQPKNQVEGGNVSSIVERRLMFKAQMRGTTKLDPSQDDETCFQGAIGEISAPSAIKSILRPHQQSGITFLWNCLTGACPKLQRLLKLRDERKGENSFDYDIVDVRAGAILADEMGKCYKSILFS